MNDKLTSDRLTVLRKLDAKIVTDVVTGGFIGCKVTGADFQSVTICYNKINEAYVELLYKLLDFPDAMPVGGYVNSQLIHLLAKVDHEDWNIDLYVEGVLVGKLPMDVGLI